MPSPPSAKNPPPFIPPEHPQNPDYLGHIKTLEQLDINKYYPWKKKFLLAYTWSWPSIMAACVFLDIPRDKVIQERKKNEKFAAGMLLCQELAIERLERHMYLKGIGVTPLKLGADTIAIAIMNAYKPDVYKYDRQPAMKEKAQPVKITVVDKRPPAKKKAG